MRQKVEEAKDPEPSRELYGGRGADGESKNQIDTGCRRTTGSLTAWLTAPMYIPVHVGRVWVVTQQEVRVHVRHRHSCMVDSDVVHAHVMDR